MNPFWPQGGKNVAFWDGLKWPYLGFGVSGEVIIFLFQSLDISGPTWGEAHAEKYLHPSGPPPEGAAPWKWSKSDILTGLENLCLEARGTFWGSNSLSEDQFRSVELVLWPYMHHTCIWRLWRKIKIFGLWAQVPFSPNLSWNRHWEPFSSASIPNYIDRQCSQISFRVAPRSSRPERIVLGVFGVHHGTCTHQAHTGTRVNFAVSQKIEFRHILKFLSLPATFTKHMLRINFAFRGSI